jgi:predicted outer membrane repeat protein
MAAVTFSYGNNSASVLHEKRLLPLAAALAFCISSGTHAATIIVNNAAAGSVMGMCTIVDAVTAINTQTAVNGCMAGDSNNDTVDLTGFTAPTTIAFTQPASGFSHALALNKDMTITGALDSGGMPYVTLERNLNLLTPNFGLIETTAALTLYGLTLTNGSAQGGTLGGAILAGNVLVVNNSVIISNFSSSAGGGIAANNSVTLNHSTISGNTAADMGGGISSNSSVHVYYSTLSGNSTTSASGAGGGGIYSSGSVVVGNSTISSNTSAAAGGGINTSNSVTLSASASTLTGNTAQAGAGGAVFAINAINSNSSVGATASTINGNNASTEGGGIYANDATLTNSTITGNTATGSGGGIYATTATMNYCTVFANTTQGGIGGGLNFAISATATATILYGNMVGNMSGDDVNTPSHSALSGSDDIIANSAWGVPADTISCDPMLGSLGNFGGPTMTLPLMTGSCALDAASATPSLITDQRGYPRPAVGEDHFKADIGAFERQPSDDPDLIFANGFE